MLGSSATLDLEYIQYIYLDFWFICVKAMKTAKPGCTEETLQFELFLCASLTLSV